jgi:hypothetical protein
MINEIVILPDSSNLIALQKTSARVDPRVISKMDSKQKEVIVQGINDGLDVSIYMDPRFSAEHMELIRILMRSGVDPKPYANPNLNLNHHMSDIILRAEQSGIDLHEYLERGLDTDQLHEVHMGLETGCVGVMEKYAFPIFDPLQLRQIRYGCGGDYGYEDIDISLYAKPEFNWMQMDIIRTGLQLGLNASVYANPEMGWEEMKRIMEEMKEGKGNEK